jgi:hypothetical protein
VTVLAANVLATAEFLDDDLFRPELIDDFPDHTRAVNHGRADGGRAVFSGEEQDFGENQLVAWGAVTTINPNPITFLDSELVTPVLDDRVHQSNLLT